MCVLILGGARYYLKAIEAAKELGVRVCVVDRDCNAPAAKAADVFRAIDTTDTKEVLALARRERINGIVALNDYSVPTAAHVAHTLGLPGIPPEVAANAVNKHAMRILWRDRGVPSARFRAAWTIKEAKEAAEAIGWPVVLKPSWSLGGASRGVSLANGPEDLERAWNFAESFRHDDSVLVEERLIGSEHSAETLTWNGETHVVAIGDKVKTDPPYRVDKSVIYPTLLRGTAFEQACETIRDAVRALGITHGAAHVEFCVTSQGAKLFEIGARCGGGGTPAPIVPYVTGIEMFKKVILLSIGLPVGDITPTVRRGCTYHFLTPRAGVVREVFGLEAVRRTEGILDCDVFVAPGDRLSDVRIGTERAGFIIAGGPDRSAALALANHAEQRIFFTYRGSS